KPDKDAHHQRGGVCRSRQFSSGKFLRSIIKTNKLIQTMKKLFLFASALVLSAGVFAQQAQKAEEVLKFKELSYDFGKIKQGSPVAHDFAFTNTSDNPVIIESAMASCGCTTPVKPEGAIQKGKDDVMKAG